MILMLLGRKEWIILGFIVMSFISRIWSRSKDHIIFQLQIGLGVISLSQLDNFTWITLTKAHDGSFYSGSRLYILWCSKTEYADYQVILFSKKECPLSPETQPSQLRLENTPTAYLQRGKTYPTSILDMSLNGIWWWGSSIAKDLGNAEYPLIVIAPRSTLAGSGSIL